MKKLSMLFAAFALSMGSTFAEGDGESVVITASNFSDVAQTGETHFAKVDQLGEFNNSSIIQVTDENEAYVTQLNTAGKNYPLLSEITQTGGENYAEVHQTSNNKDSQGIPGTIAAYIVQGGNGNAAVQVQGPHKTQGVSKLYIDQEGNDNVATQHQVKYGNEASIIQTGDNNSAKQAQDSELLDGDEGSMNQAEITQEGMWNDAEQTQNGLDNYAEIKQPGSNNLALQNQFDWSWKNMALISQTGDCNEARQDQLGYNNKAKIDQSTAGNSATQTQISLVLVRQSVDGIEPINCADIKQYGGDGNTADQFQWSPGIGLPNSAIAVQDGCTNNAAQFQAGFDNYSNILQTGVCNRAFVSQATLPDFSTVMPTAPAFLSK